MKDNWKSSWDFTLNKHIFKKIIIIIFKVHKYIHKYIVNINFHIPILTLTYIYIYISKYSYMKWMTNNNLFDVIESDRF